MKFFLKNRILRNKAFTLVETLIALSIFSVSILALLIILSNGISDTNSAQAKIVGTYLAQEGIEFVRNLRDTCMLYPSGTDCTDWAGFSSKLTVPSAACDLSNGCYFGDLVSADFSDSTQAIANVPFTACSSTCPTLLYTAGGKYNYVSGTNSGFVRKINVTTISANEIKVTATVIWTQNSRTFQTSFSENLFNWAE